MHKPFLRVEAACASGAAATVTAIDAMRGGAADVVLIAGGEVEANVRAKEGVEFMARAAHYEKQRPLSAFTFPYLFAKRAKAYKETYKVSDEDVARVVCKAYKNAAQNPYSQMRHVELTLEDVAQPSKENYLFLEDPSLAPHMKSLECTHFTDGASAILLATPKGLERLGIAQERCTEILGYGFSVRALDEDEDQLCMTNMQHAAKQAYERCSLGPSDVQVAEVHDCFAITELQICEALGFADQGRAGTLLKEGHTELDGRLPINTGGGLLGFGHPIGATGVKQVLEIHRQMKGACGDYQMASAPSLGLTANLGGNDRTAIVMLHKNT